MELQEPTLKMRAVAAIPHVRPFMSAMQLSVMSDACRGEEKDFFFQKFIDLAQLIDTMPKTYEQNGMGDETVAHLHYFFHGFDWYITEKDIEGGVDQAFGYMSQNNVIGRGGYTSIEEITGAGAELDLYFKPCKIAEIKSKHESRMVARPSPKMS